MDTSRKQAVFDQLFRLVQTNLNESFQVTEKAAGNISVDTQKPVEIAGREKPNLNFLSIIIQKHHVGFYFMPIYMDENLRERIPDTLIKKLKGKNCFHFKADLSPQEEEQLTQMLLSGMELYRSKDWL